MKTRIVTRLAMLVSIFCLVILCNLGCSGSSTDKVSKKYKLSPKATKRISFKIDKETTVNFHTNFSAEQIAKCRNGGVRVTFRDKTGAGEQVSATSSGHLKVYPEKGKVSLSLKNLEAFPIKLFVSWRK